MKGLKLSVLQGRTDVCLFSMLCFVKKRIVQQINHWPRGVCVRVCVSVCVSVCVCVCVCLFH